MLSDTGECSVIEEVTRTICGKREEARRELGKIRVETYFTHTYIPYSITIC